MNEDVVVMNRDDVFEVDVHEHALGMREEKMCLPLKTEKEDIKAVIRGDKVAGIGKTLTASSSAESVGIRGLQRRGSRASKEGNQKRDARGGRRRGKNGMPPPQATLLGLDLRQSRVPNPMGTRILQVVGTNL